MDIHVYTFEELAPGEPELPKAYQSATEWFTQNYSEADEYARAHGYRIIDNTFIFEDSELVVSYIPEDSDEDEEEEDDEDEENRDLGEVLEQLLAAIPEVEPYLFLRRRIVDLQGTVPYTAPELMYLCWGSLAMCLEQELGDPNTNEVTKKVAAIMAGENDA